jgi:hypothetical protein
MGRLEYLQQVQLNERVAPACEPVAVDSYSFVA